MYSAAATTSQLAMFNSFFTSIITTAQYRSSLRFCFEAFSTNSSTVRIVSIVDTYLRNPNCIFDSPCSPSAQFISLLRMILSRSSPSVSSKQMGLNKAGSLSGCPDFGSSTSWIFHIHGKLPSSRHDFCKIFVNMSGNARMPASSATFRIPSVPKACLSASLGDSPLLKARR